MALFVTWTATQLAFSKPVPKPMLAIAGIGLVLIFLTSVRAVWIGALLGLLAVVLLVPRPRMVGFGARVAVAGLAALGLAIGVALWTDALKSPFLALAFWFPLGLLLVSQKPGGQTVAER